MRGVLGHESGFSFSFHTVMLTWESKPAALVSEALGDAVCFFLTTVMLCPLSAPHRGYLVSACLLTGDGDFRLE